MKKIPNPKSQIGKPSQRALFVLLLIALPCAATIALAADVEFKIITVKNVTEPNEIAVFRDELILGSEQIQRIVVSDVLNDGFDENDAIQLYPSGRVIRLQPISPNLDALLRSYRLPSNVEIHETRQYFSRYDSLSRERRGGQALGYGLLGGLGERVMKGYRGETVEGYFKFAPSGAVIQAWNFDSSKVGFPPPEATIPDTVMIVIHDTIRVPEVITVATVTHDTIYIPEELKTRSHGYYYRMALGTLGGNYNSGLREASRGRVVLAAGNEWDFGVWDPWISGRQDIDSRIGLRFMAEMAPWKTDTLSPRFLGTSFEAMYIPAWDRSFFLFGGVRAYYHDDVFWDRARAAWDQDVYQEDAVQDLSQYELTVKTGLDKFSAYGTGKRLGAWVKLSGWVPGSRKGGYTVEIESNSAISESYHWGHNGGVDLEGAMIARLGEAAQMSLSLGNLSIPDLEYNYVQTPGPATIQNGSINLSQFYQTVALRVLPYNLPTSRLTLEAAFRSNTVVKTFAKGSVVQDQIESLFMPYFETPELTGRVQFDISVISLHAGVKYYLPPENLDAQLRMFGGLYFMAK